MASVMKRDPWYYGTWEGARVSMHEQNLRLTLAEKIRILEDMEQLAVRFRTLFRFAKSRWICPSYASGVLIA